MIGKLDAPAVLPRLADAVGPALRPVRVEVRRARQFDQRTRGWADPRTRTIVVYWHPLWSVLGQEITLLHELVHLTGKAGCASHGRRFKLLLLRAAARAWSLELGHRGPTLARCSSAALEEDLYWSIIRSRAWTRVWRVVAFLTKHPARKRANERAVARTRR